MKQCLVPVFGIFYRSYENEAANVTRQLEEGGSGLQGGSEDDKCCYCLNTL